MDKKLHELFSSVCRFVTQRIHTLLFLIGLFLIDISACKYNSLIGLIAIGLSFCILGILTDHEGDGAEKR